MRMPQALGTPLAVLATGLSLSLAAPAVHAAGAIDAYYTAVADLQLDQSGVGELEFDDGDGFGVKGRFELTPQFFVAGEYQANDYERLEGSNVDGELDQIRGGLGFRFLDGSPFYLLGEYVNVDATLGNDHIEEDGYGVHIGGNSPVSNGLNVYAQIGYVDINELGDGVEFLGGIAFMFSESLGLFADYRHTTLEGDTTEFTLPDVRTGLRLALR